MRNVQLVWRIISDASTAIGLFNWVFSLVGVPLGAVMLSYFADLGFVWAVLISLFAVIAFLLALILRRVSVVIPAMRIRLLDAVMSFSGEGDGWEDRANKIALMVPQLALEGKITIWGRLFETVFPNGIAETLTKIPPKYWEKAVLNRAYFFDDTPCSAHTMPDSLYMKDAITLYTDLHVYSNEWSKVKYELKASTKHRTA